MSSSADVEAAKNDSSSRVPVTRGGGGGDPAKRPSVDEDEYPMRALTINLPLGGRLHFNPLTSFIGLAVLLSLVVWCGIDPEQAKESLSAMKTEVSLFWTWFYIGTQGVWMFFVFYIAGKYGHIKLGAPDEKPEFGDVSYFTMLFAAGVAVGLFFYGVSEPLWHADTFHATSAWPNRFSGAGYHTMNEVDLYAMTITYFHWALAAWAPYLVVAICASLGTYNFGLPMTMRSAVYPLLGELTWGWMGDFVDGFTIVTVVSGVCTSLGLGAMQLVTGLRSLGALSANPDPDDNSAEIVAIWCVTAVATLSVVSGLDVGIKLLSYIAFFLGSALWFLVLTLDKTSFLLNLMVEGTGSYFYWLPFMTFATDAFAQLPQGGGQTTDGLGAVGGWMNAWTVFYFAWWTAWSSFVGLFVARISRGRKLRSLILFTLIGPFVYVMMWFSVFGGAGLRQARVAGELIWLGDVRGDPKMYQIGNTSCYTPPLTPQWYGSKTVTVDNVDTVVGLYWEYDMPGISPVCILDTGDADSAWFNVLNSYYGVGNFLSGLSLVAIAIYFVTSSDSGSLIVDQLASNGRFDHHWSQRVLWAMVEGGVATALIASGGKQALQALQAASIIAGLPFTVILCFACYSIVKFCHHIDTVGRRIPGAGPGAELSSTVLQTQFYRLSLFEESPTTSFVMPLWGGVLHIFEHLFSFGMVHPELRDSVPLPTTGIYIALLKGAVVPFVSVFETSNKLDSRNKNKIASIALSIFSAALFVGWIVCFIVDVAGMRAFAWLFFFSNAFVVAYLRFTVRERYNIDGNLIWDVLASLVMYPQVLCQIDVQLTEMANNTRDDDDDTQRRSLGDDSEAATTRM